MTTPRLFEKEAMDLDEPLLSTEQVQSIVNFVHPQPASGVGKGGAHTNIPSEDQAGNALNLLTSGMSGTDDPMGDFWEPNGGFESFRDDLDSRPHTDDELRSLGIWWDGSPSSLNLICEQLPPPIPSDIPLNQRPDIVMSERERPMNAPGADGIKFHSVPVEFELPWPTAESFLNADDDRRTPSNEFGELVRPLFADPLTSPQPADLSEAPATSNIVVQAAFGQNMASGYSNGYTKNPGSVPNPPASRQRPPYSVPVPGPTAAELLGLKKGRYYRKTRIPLGLQRIKTQETVEHLAAQVGVAIPPLLDSDVASYFHWQQQRPSKPLASFSPPANVDIRLLGKIRITAAEYLAFFPNHFKWHDGIYRLVQNGWLFEDIAGYSNYVRQLSGEEGIKRSHIQLAAREADRQILGMACREGPARRRFKTCGFTAENWVPPVLPRLEKEMIDYFIVDLAEGVVKWPTGKGVGLLTHVIRYAIEHGCREVKLSQIHNYIHHIGLDLSLLPLVLAMQFRRKTHPDVAVRNELLMSGEQNGSPEVSS